MAQQYWDRLGVSRSATDREIRRAFLAAYGHPWQPGHARRRAELTVAYELLQCRQTRACLDSWPGGSETALLTWVRQRCCFDAFAELGLTPQATLREVQAACKAMPKPHSDTQQLAQQLAACFHVDRYRQWLAQGYVSTLHEAVPVRLALTLENATHSLGLLTDLSLRRCQQGAAFIRP